MHTPKTNKTRSKSSKQIHKKIQKKKLGISQTTTQKSPKNGRGPGNKKRN